MNRVHRILSDEEISQGKQTRWMELEIHGQNNHFVIGSVSVCAFNPSSSSLKHCILKIAPYSFEHNTMFLIAPYDHCIFLIRYFNHAYHQFFFLAQVKLNVL